MLKNVIMPALGVAQETGRVVQWLKAEGDKVSEGELLLEIETDKSTVELESPASGFLRNVTAQPGDDIPVGTVIAKIWVDDKSEEVATAEPDVTSGNNSSGDQVASIGQQVTPEVKKSPRVPADSPALSQTPGRVPSSPKAKRLAAERGIDISTLGRHGAGGAVRAADVMQHDGKNAKDESHIEVSRIWRIMVERLTQAWNTVPHFYLVREADCGQLVAWHQRVRERTGQNITLSDLLVKKVAGCLCSHPQLNSEWRNGNIVRHAEMNIGLAVAVENGLIVPVIRNADQLTVSRIATERSRLVRQAQAGNLSPTDLSEGTFTISNLGMYGVDSFQAIVNPPQAAILAVGRIASKVVVVNDSPTVRPMMTFTVSCDHRVADGTRGAQFLADLVTSIEQADPSEH